MRGAYDQSGVAVPVALPDRRLPTPRPTPPARSARSSGRPFATCSMRSVSSTRLPPRSSPRCSTRASISARSARCTASSIRTARVRERRDQLRHPTYHKPELLATAPNQVWSWDITKLLGPAKWTYFYLYVILDIFSRYVVGWMLAIAKAADLAKRLIARPGRKQGIVPDQLTIHAIAARR